MKHVSFAGRLVIVGFGSIGQGVLPLILRHIDMPAERIVIVTAEERGHDVANEYGIRFEKIALTRDNYRSVLQPLLGKGDYLLNLSVDVSSVALIELAQEFGAMYLDTCIEPWAGGYTDPSKTPSQRSNYALRDSARTLIEKYRNGPTAVLTHGANPGLVSHFVKDALLNIAKDTGVSIAVPKDRAGWGALAQTLGVKVIHIAERDTQVAEHKPKERDEFVNTWSIDGFVGEGCQPAELGWGSHEKQMPVDARRHDFGCDSAIYLLRPGAGTKVRTWTPLEGPFHGFLVTHNEAISISDYYTVKSGDKVAYRPTVHYAYHPADDAVLSVHEIAGKNWEMQSRKRLMMDEITSGMDELGVLLMGHKKGAYWYGSRLTIEDARRLAPHNNATSLQVTVAVLGGLIWAMENPNAGLVEADELDHARIMEICRPYLGEMAGEYSDWTPLQDRETLFPEDLDRNDPWQFKNFRVI
ncbi:MAG: saccharopine dehydrogenase NADP-binding domain-containing protein [Ferrovibrio sp.]|uniref:homospermidine synthase n=1 Tax=Ferrovibrio sp. TaxID=1917215 RepID=UPI00262D5F4E|nr:saccharopine dehydrogenase C-terminal domain-containing protein [Ferrovibrio sp.]MCW0236498.1 saccharopine dehydrogenase NADP-binding domain-containing protein [Ferrovibrio sp.]